MTCTIISTGEELLADNKNEYEPLYLRIKAELYMLIGGLCSQGYDSFYCNCEYGIPLWAAEIIGSLKQLRDNIQLYIVTPYEEQAVQWTEEHRDRWFRVHERADSVILAGTQYHPDCYSQADRMMIEKSDLLVICGKEDNLPDAVKYAEAQGVEIFRASVL